MKFAALLLPLKAVIFSGQKPCELFKCPDKVALVRKTAFVSDVCERGVSCFHKGNGPCYFLLTHILSERTAKVPAEMFGDGYRVHTSCCR